MRHSIWRTAVLAISVACLSAPHAQAQQPAPPARLEASTIYERSIPAVVLINTRRAGSRAALGSGVIVRADGVIVTNYHLIADADSASVLLSSGEIYDDVTVLDVDVRKDIAVLKIKAINLPTIPAGDSDSVKVGALVYAIGAPQGLTGSLSSGLVSSIRMGSEVSGRLAGFRVIQFTAPISGGSSGGPLLDESGRLLGLVFAYMVDGQNIKLAIPVNYVTPIVSTAGTEGRRLRKSPIAALAELPNITVGVPVSTTNDLAGTYTGRWASDDYGVYGNLVMTVAVVNGEAQVDVALTGSEYVKGDKLIVTLTPMGEGVWRMDYKGKKTGVKGTGLFKGGTFVGDYKFKKFLWSDHGKWELEK
jgi:S1-C subfamily serine protease